MSIAVLAGFIICLADVETLNALKSEDAVCTDSAPLLQRPADRLLMVARLISDMLFFSKLRFFSGNKSTYHNSSWQLVSVQKSSDALQHEPASQNISHH